MPPKISITVRTASKDDFLACQGITSAFESLLWCLEHQTFWDFEFIYVDTYYEQNRERFAAVRTSLPVKHVPVHQDHRYWYDQGWAYMTAATNTALLYADGELFISIDDAEFFDSDLLMRYWKYYQQGACMHAAHRHASRIDTNHGGKPRLPISGDIRVIDNRAKHVKQPVTVHKAGSWLYAGKSFTLEDALKLNGFNERLDGCSTLEDSEFGARLMKLGRKFTYDLDGCVYIVEHPSYVNDDPTAKRISRNFIAIENYGLIDCVNQLGKLVANRDPITDEELQIINAATLKYRKFDIFSDENAERLAIWKAVPTFDLRKQREELRKSPDWKW